MKKAEVKKPTIDDMIDYVNDMIWTGLALRRNGSLSDKSAEISFNEILSIIYALQNIEAITLNQFNDMYKRLEGIKA